MMSSMINREGGGDGDDDDDEGESQMPGDYGPWPRAVPRTAAPRTAPPSRPPISRPRQRPPMVHPTVEPRRQRPVSIAVPPVSRRRRSQRPLTPEIIIERRHHHHHSSGRNRVITIPLDNRPTLGLRGPPKRVLELERVRCHRRRKSRLSCYEIDYGVPPPPQSNVIFANTVPNPCLPQAQSSLMTSTSNAAASAAFLSNLTPEMIENLPKQTIHLPPIHMPGSQVDDNTQLHTIVFPAEIINPIDGTLSIIRANPTASSGGIQNHQPIVPVPSQSQLFNIPTNVQVPPPVPPPMLSGPFMQQFHNLVQRISSPQIQPSSPPSNPPFIQSSVPPMPQYNSANTPRFNPQTVPLINRTNMTQYPPANIRPTNTQPTGSYRPTTFTSSSPGNPMPYSPANITPYSRANTTPYSPANITPYRPANFTQSSAASNRSYHPTSIAPSNSSNVGPYSPANITPYSPMLNRSGGSSMQPPYIPSGSTPYISSSSGPSNSYPMAYSSPPGIDNRTANAPNSSQTPYQSDNTMPKSILRNSQFNTLSNTTYSRFNPASVSSPNSIVRRKTATFA